MNYGYDSETEYWKEERKQQLADTLSEVLHYKIGRDLGGRTPFIEVDGLYLGVRIRRITNLNTSDIEELVARADKIYNEVMLN